VTFVQVLYSDSFRKQVQGKAAFVLDTPEMRRVKETQRIISGVRWCSHLDLYHYFAMYDIIWRSTLLRSKWEVNVQGCITVSYSLYPSLTTQFSAKSVNSPAQILQTGSGTDIIICCALVISNQNNFPSLLERQLFCSIIWHVYWHEGGTSCPSHEITAANQNHPTTLSISIGQNQVPPYIFFSHLKKPFEWPIETLDDKWIVAVAGS